MAWWNVKASHASKSKLIIISSYFNFGQFTFSRDRLFSRKHATAAAVSMDRLIKGLLLLLLLPAGDEGGDGSE